MVWDPNYEIAESTYRVYRRPTVPLLVSARSTGHYRVFKTWRQIPKKGNFIELFWGISGECLFGVDGQQQAMRKDDVFFYLPGDDHLQQSVCDGTEFYWMTLDGDYCCEIIRAYQIPREAVRAGRCPVQLFARLFTEIQDIRPGAQYQAAATALAILHQALAAPYLADRDNKLIEDFKLLVTNNYRNSSCNIEFLVEQLGVHRTTLFRTFKNATGQAPGDYLSTFRIREAMELLIGTDLPVHEVARRCGYSDVNYFCKAFRRCCGKSPLKFQAGKKSGI